MILLSNLEITLIWIFSILGFLIIFYFLISFVIMFLISHPKKLSLKDAYDVDAKKGLIPKEMPDFKREKIKIKMRDGTIINGDFSINDDNRKIMIFAHGYTWNRNGQLKYAQFFFKYGFSILLYDERGHGENKTKFTTFGYKEGKDLDDIIKWVKEKYNPKIIGLHGESLGAATVLMSLKENPDISFAIEDCGYSNMKDVLVHKMKEFHILRFFLFGINLFLKLILHYSIYDVLPYEGSLKSNIPLLIIHGNDDKYIDVKHAYKIYKVGKGHSEIKIISGADHALSYETDPTFYENICIDFIKRNINL